MNINIVIPENCEAETITVVYKFKPAVKPVEKVTSAELAFIDSRPLKNNGKPTEKWSCKTCGAEFDSIRSCGQHSRHCGKKISKHGRFTPDQVAYLMEHWGKNNNREVAQHLGFTAKKCSDKYGSEIRKAKPDESIKATDESISAENETAAPPAPPVGERWSSNIREGIKAVGKTTEDELMQEKKSPWRGAVERIDQLFRKEFQIPPDFDPFKVFGVGQYVYHAPGRETGKIVTIDMNTKLVTVDFGSTTKKFTIEAAKAMHKEMLVRAK